MVENINLRAQDVKRREAIGAEVHSDLVRLLKEYARQGYIQTQDAGLVNLRGSGVLLAKLTSYDFAKH
jgi:hypothetical protein